MWGHAPAVYLAVVHHPPNERRIKEDDVLLFMVQLPSLFHPQSQQEDRSHHPCGGRGVELVKWACDRLYYCLRDGCRVFFCVSHSRGDIDLLPDRGPSLWRLAQLYIYMCLSHLNRRVVGWAWIDACQHISCPKTWNWVDMSCRVIRHVPMWVGVLVSTLFCGGRCLKNIQSC